jgi:hypothetical protein
MLIFFHSCVILKVPVYQTISPPCFTPIWCTGWDQSSPPLADPIWLLLVLPYSYTTKDPNKSFSAVCPLNLMWNGYFFTGGG